jgi:prevent-host-death family protein
MPTRIVNMYEAKTHLSRLVDQAAAGEDIVIARSGTPVARLSPLGSLSGPITFGLLKGRVEVADDFDAPLPDDVLAAFEVE